MADPKNNSLAKTAEKQAVVLTPKPGFSTAATHATVNPSFIERNPSKSVKKPQAALDSLLQETGSVVEIDVAERVAHESGAGETGTESRAVRTVTGSRSGVGTVSPVENSVAGGAGSSSKAATAAGSTESTTGLFGGALAGVAGGPLLLGGAAVAALAAGGGGGGGSGNTPTPPPTDSPTVAALTVTALDPVTNTAQPFVNAELLNLANRIGPNAFKERVLLLTPSSTKGFKMVETRDAAGQTIVDEAGKPVLTPLVSILDENNRVLIQNLKAVDVVKGTFENPFFDVLPRDGRYFVVATFADDSTARTLFTRATTPLALDSLQAKEFSIGLDDKQSTVVIGNELVNITSDTEVSFSGTITPVRNQVVKVVKIYNTEEPGKILAEAAVENSAFKLSNVQLPSTSGAYRLGIVGVDQFGNETLSEDAALVLLTVDKTPQLIRLVETQLDGVPPNTFGSSDDKLVGASQIRAAEDGKNPVLLKVDGINRLGFKVGSSNDAEPTFELTVRVGKTATTEAFEFSYDISKVKATPSSATSDPNELSASIAIDRAFLSELVNQARLKNISSDFLSVADVGVPLDFEFRAIYPDQAKTTFKSVTAFVLDSGVVSLGADSIKLALPRAIDGERYVNNSNGNAAAPVNFVVSLPTSDQGFELTETYIGTLNATKDRLLQVALQPGVTQPGTYRIQELRNLVSDMALPDAGAEILVFAVAKDEVGNKRAFYLDQNGFTRTLNTNDDFSNTAVFDAATELLKGFGSTPTYSFTFDPNHVVTSLDLNNTVTVDGDPKARSFSKASIDSIDGLGVSAGITLNLPVDTNPDLSLTKLTVTGLRKGDSSPVTYTLNATSISQPFIAVNGEAVRAVQFRFQNPNNRFAEFINETISGDEVDSKQLTFVVNSTDIAGNAVTSPAFSVAIDMLAPRATLGVIVDPADLTLSPNAIDLRFQVKVADSVKDVRGADLSYADGLTNRLVKSIPTAEFANTDAEQIGLLAERTVVAKVNVFDEVGNSASSNSVRVTSDRMSVFVTDNPDTEQVDEFLETFVLSGGLQDSTQVDVLFGNQIEKPTAFREIRKGDFAVGGDSLEIYSRETAVDVTTGSRTPINPRNVADVFEVDAMDFGGVLGRKGNHDVLNLRVANVPEVDLSKLTTKVANGPAISAGFVEGIEIIDFSSAVLRPQDGRNTILLDVETVKMLSQQSSVFKSTQGASLGEQAYLYLFSSDSESTPGGLLSPGTTTLFDSIKFAEELKGLEITGGGLFGGGQVRQPEEGWFAVGGSSPNSIPGSTTYDVSTIQQSSTGRVDEGVINVVTTGFTRYQYNDADGNAVVSVWISGMNVAGTPMP